MPPQLDKAGIQAGLQPVFAQVDVLCVGQVPVVLPVQDVVHDGLHGLLDVSLAGGTCCAKVFPCAIQVQGIRSVRLLHQGLLLDGPPQGVGNTL
ncbi:hypothetical protein D9M71_814370 [compost metagenome]